VMVVRSYRREYGKQDDADDTQSANRDLPPL